MATSPSTSEAAVFTALGQFLQLILPATCGIFRGQQNRVPEPQQADFILMWPLFRKRLTFNSDLCAEIAFTGSIAGTLMTTSGSPAIITGSALDGPNLAVGSTCTGSLSANSFTVQPSQTVTSQVIYSGSITAAMPTQITVQIDVHGPNAGDNAELIATWLRDGYAYDTMSPSGVAPLNATDPRQVPFVNGEDQYEYRWSIDAELQINPTSTVPMQFSGAQQVKIYELP